jgi:DNA polymerase III epsilon subunit-like protein
MADLFEQAASIIHQAHGVAVMISNEQARSAPVGFDAIVAAHDRRKELQEQTNELSRLTRDLISEANTLPKLPDLDAITWARAVIAMPNTALLEIDTTGLNYNDPVIRVLTMNLAGEILFDMYLRPTEPATNQDLTGIPTEVLDSARLAIEVYPEITKAFVGKFLISYGWEFDHTHLRNHSQQLTGTSITIFGECLQNKASSVYGRGYYTKLVDCAAAIGHVMPEVHDAPARAEAARQVLLALAEGKPPVVEAQSQEKESNDSEFPF